MRSFVSFPWLFTVFAGCLCLASCSRPVSSGVAVDGAFKPLIQPETNVLAGMSIDRLKATPLYQRHQKELDFPLFDASVQRLGFDPRRDLSELLFASTDKTGVWMALGRFQPKEIEAKLQSSGFGRQSYKTYTLLGDGRNSVAFLKGGLLLVGSLQTVQSELDFQQSGSGEVPEELQERLRTLPKNDQVWIVSRKGLPFAETPMRIEVQSALSNILAYIRGTTAGLAADNGLHLQVNLTCVSNEGAKRVHDAIRGGIGLLRLSTRDNETDILKLYDAIEVNQDQDLVRVHADLSGDVADKLLSTLPQIKSRSDGFLRNQQ